MIGGLAALLQDLYGTSRLLGHLANQVHEQLPPHRTRTGASGQDAIRGQDVERREVQAKIRLEGMLDVLGLRRVFGRVANHHAETLTFRPELFQDLEHVSGLEMDPLHAVDRGVDTGSLDGGGRAVDTQGFGSVPVLHCPQRECPGETKEVDHPLTATVPGHGAAIVSLIQVEAGLLTRTQVRLISQAILDDLDRAVRDRADGRFLTGSQSFPHRKPTLRPGDYPVDAGLLAEESEQEVAPVVEGETRELGDEPAIVAIDGQAGEAVSLTEDQPTGGSLSIAMQYVAAQPKGRSQPMRPERLVERPVIPSIEPDPDRTPRIVQTPTDELLLRADDGHLIAGLGIPFDTIDRRVEDPGMACKEGTGTARLDDDTAVAIGSWRFDFSIGSGVRS
jgi:hypothetical protein